MLLQTYIYIYTHVLTIFYMVKFTGGARREGKNRAEICQATRDNESPTDWTQNSKFLWRQGLSLILLYTPVVNSDSNFTFCMNVSKILSSFKFQIEEIEKNMHNLRKSPRRKNHVRIQDGPPVRSRSRSKSPGRRMVVC